MADEGRQDCDVDQLNREWSGKIVMLTNLTENGQARL
jgi:hypothetical protein